MANNHSAEFLRGAKWWADQHTTGYKQLCALLAAAEAREAGERKQSADDRLDEALHHVYAKYGPRLDLFFADVEKAREAAQPTAAEVIEELHGCFDTIKHLSADIGTESGDIAVNGVALLGLAKIARWKEANHGK